MAPTPFDEMERVFRLQREAHAAAPSPRVAARRERIGRLLDAVLAARGEIHEALRNDFGKAAPEVDLSEILPVVGEARHARRHVKGWMKPRRARAPLGLLGTSSHVHFEPKGCALVISPWNFPFNLTFGPLVSALAAGCRVVLKPSETTTHASALMARIVRDTFDPSEVALFEGDQTVAQHLLGLPFDHVFFTGSPRVGKLVMKAAAEHLASVTLELGGKSPAIVDATANLEEAARKIAWGKFLNCGQTCIAPDYVLVADAVHDGLVEKLREHVAALYGDGASEDYARLASDAHLRHVEGLLTDAVERGATVVAGGEVRAAERYVAPTIMTDVPPDARILRQEIFGPLLPVVRYERIEEALAFVNAGETPLALYVFSQDRRLEERVIAETSAGGTCVNDTLIHFFQVNLPFGGTGNSGVGKSHGRYGFEAFSNARPVLRPWTRWSPVRLMYPPYTKRVRRLIELAVRYL